MSIVSVKGDYHGKGQYHLPIGVCAHCGRDVAPDFAIRLDDKYDVVCSDCLEYEVVEVAPPPRQEGLAHGNRDAR